LLSIGLRPDNPIRQWSVGYTLNGESPLMLHTRNNGRSIFRVRALDRQGRNEIQMLAKIAAVLSTLKETNGAPESHLYIFFGMDLDLWTRIRDILISENLIQVKGHFVTLTPFGIQKATQIDKVVNKARN
jgi:hypothetical protein